MQEKRSKRVKDPEKLPRYCLVLLGVAGLALLLYIIAAISNGFADWFHATVGAGVRALLAHLTTWLPLSLSEILLLLSPLLIGLVSVHGFRHRCQTWKSSFVYIGCILSVASIFFSLFVFTLGCGYHTTPLEERLGLEVGTVSEEELYQTALLLAKEVNLAADGVTFGENGFSEMPYDLKQMNAHLLDGYADLCEEYAFVSSLSSRVKPVLASRLMSYTHITGVYSYFTGEANLNVDFPDYTLPFTAAHELAHQRGIARENEANFVAFLAAERSDDPYIRYSAYLNLFEYVAGTLQRSDPGLAGEVISSLRGEVRGELRAYSEFFDAYRDSAAADLSGAVNDTYLKLNGNKAGAASYGLVVGLAVAYFR